MQYSKGLSLPFRRCADINLPKGKKTIPKQRKEENNYGEK